MNSDSLSRRGLIAGGACAAMVAGAAAVGTATPRALADDAPDFQGFYDGLDSDEQECCTVYEDGSGILIDTNPDDKDGGDYLAASYAYNAIYKAFDEFPLPQILIGMFGQCSASDGWQSRIRNNYEVTWKYYPDAGLRVFIEWLG